MLNDSIVSYINGNYFVYLDRYTGTKIKRALRVGEELVASFPDSIDLKITNKCLWGCPFCHESSNSNGNDFNFRKTTEILDQLPKVGIELAIGGGNLFEIPDLTLKFLKWAKENKFVTRITLNSKDFFSHKADKKGIYYNILRKVEAVGVSMNNYVKFPLGERDWLGHYSNSIANTNIVYHVIVGVISLKHFYEMIYDKNDYNKILILGFKQFGRASNMKVEHLEEWRSFIRENIGKIKGKTIGFDNLAIEQLQLKEVFPKNTWETTYFGNEFSSTMYIDAVEGKFAPTSRSIDRVSWDDINILDYFNKYKNEF